jgi:BirA family biotin operon repressor/biotin-[acetyl-CoA-carboxylase] ligase
MEAEALSAVRLRQQLATQCVGQALEVYASIASTNDRAVAWARAGAPDGAVVLADEQTAGKGRLGRRWFAPPRSALLLSVVLRPGLTLPQAPRVTMICSLAVVAAVRQVTGLPVRIKWPNDLLLEGRKLGGMLAEMGASGERLEYVVVGLGLNVNVELTELPEVMSPPASLLAARGEPVDREVLLLSILSELDVLYQQLEAGWSPHETWRQHLDTIGHEVSVGTPDEVIAGVAVDVDADGALLLRQADGAMRHVLVGDVTLRGGLAR